MSQTTATVRSGARAYRLAPPTRRPSLRVISAEPVAPKQLPFVLLCSALMAMGLIALLLLNTSLAKGAYLTHQLEVTSTRLAEDEMSLREELGMVSSAQSLAAAASKLGMIPLGQPPLTLELSTGAVRGLTRDQAPAGEDPFSVTLVPQYTAPAGGKVKDGKTKEGQAAPAKPKKSQSGTPGTTTSEQRSGDRAQPSTAPSTQRNGG